MKLGLLSDIHTNIEGLRTALDVMGDVDELICAGDAVYQFRFSNEVVRLLRERNARYVLGNHERVLLSDWGARARTAEGIDPALVAYMASQPYHLETEVNGKKLVVVHGSPFDPHDEYLYPHSPNLRKLAAIDADYLVLGHTHFTFAERIGRALVINPGSAGEPRDHRNHFQLSCAVLETETGEVTFHTFPDPTRPAIDPAHVPAANPNAPNTYRPPRNDPFWT